jgi:hypothetical protein
VTAIELGAGLAERLRTKLADPALTVTVGAFEAVELPAASFDLVAAATSFHWLPEGSVARCADLLDRDGWLAVWWTVFGDARRPDPFHRHDRAQLRALFGSVSPWLALDAERRTRTLDAMDALARDRFGGVVERPYVTAVFAAQRR